MENARHAAFIWAAYGATAVTVGGLVLRAVLDHRAQVRALARIGPDRPDVSGGAQARTASLA